jgi:hypothetical protein
MDLCSPKLGKKDEDRNAKRCTIVPKVAEGSHPAVNQADAVYTLRRVK